MLLAGADPRNDQGTLVERQDLAERVVSAHRHDPGGGFHQDLGTVVEIDEMQGAVGLRPAAKIVALLGLHEGAEHHDDRPGQRGIVVMGGDDLMHQLGAIPSPADRDQQRIGRHVGERGRRAARHFAPQKARPIEAGTERLRGIETLQGIVEVARSIDPDGIVEGLHLGQDVGLGPFGGEQGR